ncbi:MAG: hypothetical protein HFI10_07260 [Lachnospiraceae bacterium]|jgi:hypothetical protein|nr:hypothetical protein [Lachnospiraceae bacterium]
MKNVKFWGIIHGIVAVLFLFIMIIAWMPKDFRFWCLVVSMLLILGNSFCLIFYLEKKRRRNSSPLNQAVFVPVGVTFIAVIIITRYLPDIVDYNCNKYLAVHTVVFTVSFIVQFMLLQVRNENAAQEQYIREKRWNRDEAVFQWERILAALPDKGEAGHLAKKIGDEIRYSDPMSSELLAGLENEITALTGEILRLAGERETEAKDILAKERQVLTLVRERNDKCGRLK